MAEREPTQVVGTVRQVLDWGRDVLKGSPTASLDAQLLLSHALGVPRIWVFAHEDRVLDAEARMTYGDLVQRRRAGEPVAYLRGHVEWFGMSLAVSPDVLIPRPETELLVEEAVSMARENAINLIADIGTGSGAIAIALAKELPEAQILAVDASARALRVASANATVQGVEDRVRFLEGHLLEPLPTPPGMVVANLPYVSAASMQTLDLSVRYEPQGALYGGRTGLELYADMLDQMVRREWRTPFLLEIDPRQGDAARNLIYARFPDSHCTLRADYAGHDRIVIVQP